MTTTMPPGGPLVRAGLIFTVFLVLGPSVGAIVFVPAVALVQALGLSGFQDVARGGVMALIYLIAFSYLIGLVPAAVSGLIIGLWQGFVGPLSGGVAALIGLGVGAATVAALHPNLSQWAERDVTRAALLIGACLGATLACWRVVKPWHAARSLAS